MEKLTVLLYWSGLWDEFCLIVLTFQTHDIMIIV